MSVLARIVRPVLATGLAMVCGCSGNSNVRTSTSPPAPGIGAALGRPVTVVLQHARVQVSVRRGFVAERDNAGDVLADGIDVTMTNLGSRTIAPDLEDFYLAEPDDDNPWTHHDNDNVVGVDPTSITDGTRVDPPVLFALRLAPHVPVRGTLLFRQSAGPSLLYLSDDAGTDLAEWRLTMP